MVPHFKHFGSAILLDIALTLRGYFCIEKRSIQKYGSLLELLLQLKRGLTIENESKKQFILLLCILLLKSKKHAWHVSLYRISMDHNQYTHDYPLKNTKKREDNVA